MESAEDDGEDNSSSLELKDANIKESKADRSRAKGICTSACASTLHLASIAAHDLPKDCMCAVKNEETSNKPMNETKREQGVHARAKNSTLIPVKSSKMRAKVAYCL